MPLRYLNRLGSTKGDEPASVAYRKLHSSLLQRVTKHNLAQSPSAVWPWRPKATSAMFQAVKQVICVWEYHDSNLGLDVDSSHCGFHSLSQYFQENVAVVL